MHSNTSTPRSLSPLPEGINSNNMATNLQVNPQLYENSAFSSESDSDNSDNTQIRIKKKKLKGRQSLEISEPIFQMGNLPPSRNNINNRNNSNNNYYTSSNASTLVTNTPPAKKSFFSKLFSKLDWRKKKEKELVLPVTVTKEEKKKKKKQRNCCLIILLVIIILLLLGNLLALDVIYFHSPVLQAQNITTLLNNPQITPSLEQNLKATICMTLLGTTPPINFICDQCSDDQSFYNVTTFCVLKSIWTNAFNQTSIESLGWMRDTLFCEWNGIKCDNNNNIIELELKFPNIPKATQTFGLGKLKTLQRLTIIGGAGFPFGPLPFSIFQLENLVDLALISTNYTNTIPNTFDKMTSLKSLRIANNYQLNSFIIPDTISTTSLVTLVFSQQNVNGAIPDFIGNSITLQNSLQNLDLSSNNLTGNIPNSLFNLRNLQSLRLGTNSLTGQIPPGLTSSKFTNSLTSIDLSANWFSGNIPTSLNKFVNLISLNLETNLLTGPIPAELSTLNLNDLILENNQLSGSIPDSIGNINLRNLRLRNNTLTGFIPPSICQRRTYAFCTMGQNQFQVQTGLSCGDCAFG